MNNVTHQKVTLKKSPNYNIHKMYSIINNTLNNFIGK